MGKLKDMTRRILFPGTVRREVAEIIKDADRKIEVANRKRERFEKRLDTTITIKIATVTGAVKNGR